MRIKRLRDGAFGVAFQMPGGFTCGRRTFPPGTWIATMDGVREFLTTADLSSRYMAFWPKAGSR